MSSYANFNSPQFVDFLSHDAFDINDGADHLFEEYFVGEGKRQVRSDEGTNRFLADLRNMSMKSNEQETMPLKAVRPSPAPATEENKENSAAVAEMKQEKTEIVGTTAPGVGSALDLMNIAASAIAPAVRAPLIKTSSVDHNGAQANNYPKQRTMSNSVVMSTPLLSNKPTSQAPAHNGVAWIPKMGARKQLPTTESDNERKTPEAQPQSSSATTTTSAAVTNPTRPIIAGSHDENKKPVVSGLTRATPGKSASMRGNDKKPTNIIKQLLTKPRPLLTSKPPMPHHESTHANAEKKTSSSNLAASRAAHNMSSGNNNNNNNTSTMSNTSHMRKVSESKIPLGFLHTELRAQKRHEFDAIIKEKERQAAEQRMMYEQEKQRQEQEMVQQLRSKLTFKSQPIRHYKTVDIKPSERPLTSPKSPHLGAILPNKNESQLSLPKKNSPLLGTSHDDLGF